MNYEEREKTLCNNCEARENCAYISRNLERNCSFKETTMYGWELGWQDAIDKVCELLNRMVCEITYEDPHENSSAKHYDKDEFIQDFKKAMEEQL